MQPGGNFARLPAAEIAGTAGGFPNYETLVGRLGKLSRGKSCLYVKRLGDIDLEVLEALIRGSLAPSARPPSEGLELAGPAFRPLRATSVPRLCVRREHA